MKGGVFFIGVTVHLKGDSAAAYYTDSKWHKKLYHVHGNYYTEPDKNY
jgi:hypothetical protein